MLTAWDALAADAAEPNCFYAPEMLLPAIRHLTQEKDVLLLQAWEGDELIGLLPVTTAHCHGRLPIATITNRMPQHCFYAAPLIRSGYDRASWTNFLAVLDTGDWAPNYLPHPP